MDPKSVIFENFQGFPLQSLCKIQRQLKGNGGSRFEISRISAKCHARYRRDENLKPKCRPAEFSRTFVKPCFCTKTSPRPSEKVFLGPKGFRKIYNFHQICSFSPLKAAAKAAGTATVFLSKPNRIQDFGSKISPIKNRDMRFFISKIDSS